jgi:hypothetical protein
VLAPSLHSAAGTTIVAQLVQAMRMMACAGPAVGSPTRPGSAAGARALVRRGTVPGTGRPAQVPLPVAAQAERLQVAAAAAASAALAAVSVAMVVAVVTVAVAAVASAAAASAALAIMVVVAAAELEVAAAEAASSGTRVARCLHPPRRHRDPPPAIAPPAPPAIAAPPAIMTAALHPGMRSLPSEGHLRSLPFTCDSDSRPGLPSGSTGTCDRSSPSASAIAAVRLLYLQSLPSTLNPSRPRLCRRIRPLSLSAPGRAGPRASGSEALP